ncbi:hypothetical protein BSL78_23817 [Apostichopus japonicus]|uniref:Reverse transcriptase/retrotransposon-derived protein RNase H-like domain-containing protein n=1 Tax=Stichopus japonicus TaxID=307972 RepID=A0A2G8JUE2_STIJA|nr:hypothetical protein BSL78_23817 [Apostichopus japonicus]
MLLVSARSQLPRAHCSSKGIAPNPEKITAVVDWPTPCSVTEVRSFIGLCSYYRRFIQGFSRVCAPLLTEKETKFVWCDECDLAFKKLKHALTPVPY